MNAYLLDESETKKISILQPAKPGLMQRSNSWEAGMGKVTSIVKDVLRSPGRPLDPATRAFMEPKFGRDFSGVRVYTDAKAAESARSVDALAYTVGRDVVFGTGQYAPHTPSGRYLLAHELTHVVQQNSSSQTSPAADISIRPHGDPAEVEAGRIVDSFASGAPTASPSAGANPQALYRFETSERGRIGSLTEIITATRTIARDNTTVADNGVFLDWGGFVRAIGGSPASARLGISSGTTGHLAKRYMFSCRCGLIDMRHFFQLMYISNTLWNRRATEMGRTHELESEATSRFAPEDTPSNAMGAFFGSEVNGGIAPDELVDHLETYLGNCEPVDFAGLPVADQDTIVNYYGNRDASGAPSNPNESAIPVQLGVSACGLPDRSFPFVVDPSDPNRKTITSLAVPFSLTGDAEIREWVFHQSPTTLQGLPTSEKIRQIIRLLDGYVSEGDIGAVERLCANSRSSAELGSIRTATGGREGSLWSADQRRRLHQALNP